ncbi:Calcium-activated chloride channel regulator 1 [Araneus ventricosus]|uniref:Calcium-activated chloride channel regulator 1 n=1 Tax=Araneus ventricosus TaxID=182803 RepID=A0A4Y2L0I6_ARAVE|nr:Calcium-activated chloride channel regulator 1 [Araneus ventricosus]
MEKTILISLFVLYFLHPVSTSRIKIVNNGYEDILISLDPKTSARNRKFAISNLQNIFEDASSILTTSTKGRAYFRSVTFLIPRSWGGIRTWYSRADNSTSFEDAGAALDRRNADIVVTSSKTNDFSYTLHQGGCGRRALRIYLPENHLLDSRRRLNGRDFVRLWAEFRYGIFPEGGFRGDEKYPEQFSAPDEDAGRKTGCRSEPKRLQDDCVGTDVCIKECKDECEVECDVKCKERCEKKCEKEPVVSSLADQHLPNSAVLFCEGRLSLGPNHDPSSPSKHNLLCNEEGTWFTVLRSPDFKHGRNAAPRHQPDTGLTFRFVREAEAPKIIVAVDVSSGMKGKNRYSLTKNAFSHFVATLLPSGSELSLLTFGGEGNSSSLITPSVTINDEASRISYLESQPLPEEPMDEDSSCLDCVLADILQLVEGENSSFSSAPIVILITTTQTLDSERYEEIELGLRQSKIQLMAMACEDDLLPELSSLYELCSKTGNQFVYVGSDRLKDLYGGFLQAISGHSSRQLVAQEHLVTPDEESIFFDFVLDKSVSRQLQVSISGPLFGSAPLVYGNTSLVTPMGHKLPPRKREIVPSWDFDISNPQTGVYRLGTRRKFGARSPVMVSVYGTPAPNEELISARVWVETVESKVSPPPVLIYAEVRKGNYPIRNATVTAYVHHPQGDGISELTLRDDGVGSPSSDCCGSVFLSSQLTLAGRFEREAGPATFQVTTLSDLDDVYPPSQVTDLRIIKPYDKIVSLKWTAVGDDFDTGIPTKYELKLFRNRSLIRTRFSNSELYTEIVETDPESEYGVTLHHVMDIPKLEHGIYYLGIRAVDEVENAGEPSNAVALLVEGRRTVIQCTDEEPSAEKLTSGNSASRNVLSIVLMFLLFCIHLLVDADLTNSSIPKESTPHKNEEKPFFPPPPQNGEGPTLKKENASISWKGKYSLSVIVPELAFATESQTLFRIETSDSPLTD